MLIADPANNEGVAEGAVPERSLNTFFIPDITELFKAVPVKVLNSGEVEFPQWIPN